MVPVERVEEKVEYKPVTRKIVHYPEFDQQYQEDAENSGNIRHSSGRLVGSQVISGGNNLVASQAFARPQQLAASQAFARPQSMVRSQTFARPQQMFSSQFFSGDGSYFGYPAYSGNLGVSNVRPANVGTYTSPLVSSNVVGGGLIRRSQAYSGNPGVYASQLGASNVSPIQNLAQSQIGTRPIPLSQSQVIGGASYGTNASWRIAGSGGNYTNQPYLNPSGFSGYRVNGNTLASKSQYLPQSGLPSAENGPHFIVNNIATGINMKKKKKI